jgi:hypothetical protein
MNKHLVIRMRQVEVWDQINSGSISFAYNFFVFRDFQILFVLQSYYFVRFEKNNFTLESFILKCVYIVYKCE